eukprot:scaffold41205_cov40-Attheya_sp.AAC.1
MMVHPCRGLIFRLHSLLGDFLRVRRARLVVNEKIESTINNRASGRDVVYCRGSPFSVSAVGGWRGAWRRDEGVLALKVAYNKYYVSRRIYYRNHGCLCF